MPTVSPGATTRIDHRGSGDKRDVWETVTVFSIISGDTSGTATIPINGVLQKIIVKVSDFTTGDGTVDVTLTDNGDRTIWSVSNLADPVTYMYSIFEPFASEINIALSFTDPQTDETVTVTLRGI